VGDFAAQAVISSILHHAFPADHIVGEEDASDLRAESGREMKDRIVALANEALTLELAIGDNKNWGIGPGEEKTDSEILDAIDRGNHEGGSTGREFCTHTIGDHQLNSYRYVDDRPNRRYEGLLAGRAVRCMSLAYRRRGGQIRRYWMPKSPSQLCGPDEGHRVYVHSCARAGCSAAYALWLESDSSNDPTEHTRNS